MNYRWVDDSYMNFLIIVDSCYVFGCYYYFVCSNISYYDYYL